MKIKWDSEKELGKAVVDHYRANGWTVYPEICDIDIVAVQETPTGKKTIGIECKKHFNLTVLAQAHDKKRHVDEMYVAVSRGWKDHEQFGCMIARKFGFGVLFVDKKVKYSPKADPPPWDSSKKYHENMELRSTKTATYEVSEEVQPILEPRKIFRLDKMLTPEAENFAEAGQFGAKHWTLFKKTASALTVYVKENPGKSMKEAIGNIEHHYRSYESARSSLSKAIRDGFIKEIMYEGKVLVPKPTSS